MTIGELKRLESAVIDADPATMCLSVVNNRDRARNIAMPILIEAIEIIAQIDANGIDISMIGLISELSSTIMAKLEAL